jgi:hypothetical protein
MPSFGMRNGRWNKNQWKQIFNIVNKQKKIKQNGLQQRRKYRKNESTESCDELSKIDKSQLTTQRCGRNQQCYDRLCNEWL